MKTLIPAAIRCSLVFTAVTASLFSVQPVQAYSLTLKEVGNNVVANGSGPINLTGLIFHGTATIGAGVFPSLGIINTGPTSAPFIDLYIGLTGPTGFGSGGIASADTGRGDFVVMQGYQSLLAVPHGYVSNTALSSSSTYNNATFDSLGVTPGTYVWSWGTGLPGQNFTLIIGGAGVPDGGSTVSLLGFGLLGLAALRRKLSC
jgi:hypothetical protein